MIEVIHTDDAPQAIGPYSQALRAAPFVFVSGQIPLDPATGEIVDGPADVQTERVMKNLAAVLTAAGSTLQQVVKTTIYLADLSDFSEVNRVYGTYFGQDPPARATVQVAALPKGVRIEIDAIAHQG